MPLAAYATPREVGSLEECIFYHTMDIPGHGHVEGEWDLRGREHEYLGGVDVTGKRVLEIGPASGHLSFCMEAQGAEVIAYDLSEEDSWDLVPFAGANLDALHAEAKANIRKLNNSFWLAHRALSSRVRLMHGTVYAIPEEIAPVDICTFGCVLLHLRDPFLALFKAVRLTSEMVIISEPVWRPHRRSLFSLRSSEYRVVTVRDGAGAHSGRWIRRVAGPYMIPLPEARETGPSSRAGDRLSEHREDKDSIFGTWWILTPELLSQYMGVLGFETTSVTYHAQRRKGVPILLFTIVGRRVDQTDPRRVAG